MIALAGTPEENGRIWGETNAEAVREHYMAFMTAAEERGLDDAALLSRAGRAAEIIEEIAPHWGAELDAMAEAVDLPADLHFAYHVGKYRDLLFGVPECTSYAAAGGAAAGNPIFHKSRDNTARWQGAYVKRQQLFGDQVHAYVALGDVSDAGCMMMVNERGLAASADSGPPDERPFTEGLMNPWVMRYVAERAGDCHQALEVLELMVAERYYAGGSKASNWLFVDAAGNLLRVANFNDRLEPEMVEGGLLLSIEREGLRELLEEHTGSLDAALFRRASRLPSVSMDTTICSLTADIEPGSPECTCAWVSLGRPDSAPYIPMYLLAEWTPLAMADGTLYGASLDGEADLDLLYELEADFGGRAEAAASEARALQATGDAEGAYTALEDMTAACVTDALEAMSSGR